MSDYSVGALLEWLEWAGERGLMNRTTARLRRTSCQRVFEVLDDDETSDLRTLNLEDIFTRFANTAGTELSPNSLRDYRGRMEAAVEEFLRYRSDPVNYKPSGRKLLVTNSQMRGGRTAAERERRTRTRTESTEEKDPAQATGLEYPFPLRENVIIYLKGVPTDLSLSEAQRLGRFVQSLAIDYRSFDEA